MRNLARRPARLGKRSAVTPAGMKNAPPLREAVGATGASAHEAGRSLPAVFRMRLGITPDDPTACQIVGDPTEWLRPRYQLCLLPPRLRSTEPCSLVRWDHGYLQQRFRSCRCAPAGRLAGSMATRVPTSELHLTDLILDRPAAPSTRNRLLQQFVNDGLPKHVPS